MKIKMSKGYRVFQVVNTIIMILVVFVTLYPFVWLVAQSFSSDAAVAAGQVTFLPVDFTTATYKYLLRDNRFFRYYGNTIIYSAVGTFISVVGTALLAYPLSKPELRLNKFFTPFVVFRRRPDPELYSGYSVAAFGRYCLGGCTSGCNQHIQPASYEVLLCRAAGRTGRSSSYGRYGCVWYFRKDHHPAFQTDHCYYVSVLSGRYVE